MPVATIVQPDITANGNPTASIYAAAIYAAAIYAASTTARVLIERASSKPLTSSGALRTGSA